MTIRGDSEGRRRRAVRHVCSGNWFPPLQVPGNNQPIGPGPNEKRNEVLITVKICQRAGKHADRACCIPVKSTEGSPGNTIIRSRGIYIGRALKENGGGGGENKTSDFVLRVYLKGQQPAEK